MALSKGVCKRTHERRGEDTRRQNSHVDVVGTTTFCDDTPSNLPLGGVDQALTVTHFYPQFIYEPSPDHNKAPTSPFGQCSPCLVLCLNRHHQPNALFSEAHVWRACARGEELERGRRERGGWGGVGEG